MAPAGVRCHLRPPTWQAQYERGDSGFALGRGINAAIAASHREVILYSLAWTFFAEVSYYEYSEIDSPTGGDGTGVIGTCRRCGPHADARRGRRSSTCQPGVRAVVPVHLQPADQPQQPRR